MVQYLRYMYNAVCVEYDLRHEVYIFMHAQHGNVDDIVVIKAFAETLGDSVASSLIVEQIDDKIAFRCRCIIYFFLIAFSVAIFFHKIKIDKVGMSLLNSG